MHTLETLLPLLDKDGNPINQEASDKLRVWAAELDKGVCMKCEDGMYEDAFGESKICQKCDGSGLVEFDHYIDYPTSLDDIYAAEKRAGLHEVGKLRSVWSGYALDLLNKPRGYNSPIAFALLTPAQRTVILILTLQQKQTL